MRRSRGFARRAAAFVLAVSMSASILPSALAAGSTQKNTPPRTVSENSVDELGNIDLSDEVFEVSEEPKAAAAESTAAETDAALPAEGLVVSNPETADVPLVEGDEWLGDLVRADGDYDDLISLQADWKPSKDKNTIRYDPDKHKNHVPTYSMSNDDPSSYKAPTCVSEGTKIHHCKIPFGCHNEWLEIYDKDPNNHEGPIVESTTEATCKEAGETVWVCSACHVVTKRVTIQKKDHTQPADWSDPDTWEYIKKPTCTEAGERVMLCTECGQRIDSTREPVESLGGSHDWVEDVTRHVDNTCTENGQQVFVCTICGDENTVVLTAPGHKWGAYQDDEALGCQVQTQSQYCLVCKARNTDTIITKAASVRKHKFTHYTTTTPNIEHEVNLWGLKFTIPVPTPVVSAACDYGCGEVDELDAYDYPAYAALAQASSDATESLAKSAVEMIENALGATRTAVQEATTREEAIASLDQIYTATRSQLLAKGGVDVEIHLNINGTVPDWVPRYGGRSYNIPLYNDTVTVPITEEMVDSVLGQLKAVIDNAKSMLQESFLSMEAVQVAVTKITDTVLADCADPDGMQKSLHELAFYPVYKSAGQAMNIDLREGWEKHPSDSTESALGELILRLAGSAVNDEEGWQPFVEAIIDNVSDLLIDYIRNHPKYGKYLNNSLGEELLAEMRVLIRKELADDETFVQAVRGVLGTALDNAADGVRKGWSDKKVLENLRADLLQVNDVVEDELLLLSGRLGDLVDETIQAKFRKWLPFGNLTAWIGEWVGSFAKDLVAREIAGETGSVRSTIEKYINFITCPGHDYKRVQTRDPSCVEDGELSWRCANCQWTRTDDRLTVEKLGHIVVTDEAVEPTETTDGLTEGTHCIRCGKALVPQQVIPALQPNMEQQLLCTGITATVAKSLGYESTQKLNAAIDTTLSRAGFAPADSQRYFVQVQTNLDVLQDAWDADPGELPSRILPNDRYPEQGITGYLPRPAQTAGKNCSWYALQLLTTDWDGHRAGEMIAAPLVPTEKGLQITVYAQAVVVLAWQENA